MNDMIAMKRPALLITALLLLASAAPSALAQRGLEDIPDPDPQKQLESFTPAEGFEVNLFAAEPLVRKPIQMNWDAAGRLWVATSTTYPQVKPGQEANDKIVVLEDTDNDGKADKRTVFAEGLLIPTAVVPDDAGGAYVANSTELLHLKDTDGDLKADEKRVVLSGFGTEDTHHILHTLRWGPDGAIYFNQSIYIHSHVETPWGVKRLRAGGIWRLLPESIRLNVYSRGWINAWGHQFDRWGQSFVTDGAGGQGINYAFPGAAYVRAEGVDRVLQGLNPGQPKHSGIEVLNGRHLPPEWRGEMVTNDFRGNRVNRFSLTDAGGGYVSRQKQDLLASDHVAFRPVDIRMGPDGAIYIADWYNPIIQHGEVDFRDPRRDQTRGRIWRLTYKGRDTVDPPQLDGASTTKLLDALKAPEAWTRNHARRLLQQRGPDKVLPALDSWYASLNPEADRFEHHRLEALWVHQSLRNVYADVLRDILASPNPHARAAAVRVLGRWQKQIDNASELLKDAIHDEHGRVRLEALHALRQQPTARAARLAMGVLDHETDRFIDFALWRTLRATKRAWLAKLREDGDYFGSTARLIHALRAVEDPAALQPLVERWQSGDIATDQQQATLDLIADLGRPADLKLLLDRALKSNNPQRLLQTLQRAADRRNAKPAGDRSRIVKLLDHDNATIAATAARLAGAWKVGAARGKLVALAESGQAKPAVRRAALGSLADLGGGASRKQLLRLSESIEQPGLRNAAVSALARVDLNAAASRAANLLAAMASDADPAPLLGAFLSRKQGPPALTKALKDTTLEGAIATAALRQISSAGRKAPGLAKAFQQAGGLDPIGQSLSDEEMNSLVDAVQSHGDPAHGEQIYRRTELACINCHAIAGSGGQVGPDLSSIGASAPVDYLIESLIQPQKKIKEGYHVTTVTKKDGGVAAGVTVKETEDALHLRDGADNLIRIPRDQVASTQNATVSLMPPGLTDQLRRDEFVDLVAFLAALGKSGDFTAPKARLVRTWDVLTGGDAVNDTVRHQGLEHATTDDPSLPWEPAYSRVSGELPIDDLDVMGNIDGRHYRLARFQLDVKTPGEIALRLHNPTSLTIFADKTKLKTSETVTAELEKGRHTFTVAIDITERHDRPLKIELTDAPGSDAQAQLITGK